MNASDVSTIGTGFVGQSHHGESGSVLGELCDLILWGKRPDKRASRQ
ncbi:MAG: hypothetical protein KDJ72_10700 [Methyloceanibacter sp.]|nr:hypothetical protein [Methyloceanibacter sp.]MCB1443477.1 hypothetical protein [Methyloceanibacter sp.]